MDGSHTRGSILGEADIRDRNAAALAALRISLGALFLIFAQYKVFGTGFTLGEGFQYWINRFLAEGAYPFMVPVLRNFVLPRATAIAFLTAYGELAIGLSLVLGILVRPASACGAIYMLTLLFSSNYPGAHAPLWQYFGASLEHLVPAMCFATFALADSEAMLSLGRRLRGRGCHSAAKSAQAQSSRAPVFKPRGASNKHSAPIATGAS